MGRKACTTCAPGPRRMPSRLRFHARSTWRRGRGAHRPGGGLDGARPREAGHGRRGRAQPLARVLGPSLGNAVVALDRANGVAVRLGVQVNEVLVEERSRRLLSDGDRIDTQLVVVAIRRRAGGGLAPRVGRGADHGVVVNEHGETCVPGIYAAVDVARAWNAGVRRAPAPGVVRGGPGDGDRVGRTMAGAPHAERVGALDVLHAVRRPAAGRGSLARRGPHRHPRQTPRRLVQRAPGRRGPASLPSSRWGGPATSSSFAVS